MTKSRAKVITTQEQDQILKELSVTEKNYNKMVRMTGLSKKVILRRLRELGLKINTRKFEPSEEEIQIIITRYNNGDGDSIIDIAKDLKRWVPNVRKVLVENGIEIKKIKHSKELELEIKSLIETSGLSKKRIATKVGVEVKVVNRVEKQMKVKRKEPLEYIRKKYRTFLEIWTEKHGAKKAAKMIEEYKEKHRKNSSGKNNPMYGKPSPMGSGNGWKGWYKDIYFRSLRELCFYFQKEKEGLDIKSAEFLSIEYLLNGVSRTYHPDFLIGRDIYEIKPIKLQKSIEVLAKAEAARKYCLENDYNYILTDVDIGEEILLDIYETGQLNMHPRYEDKLLWRLFKFVGFISFSYRDFVDFMGNEYSLAHKNT